jgi:hypothetical protein
MVVRAEVTAEPSAGEVIVGAVGEGSSGDGAGSDGVGVGAGAVESGSTGAGAVEAGSIGAGAVGAGSIVVRGAGVIADGSVDSASVDTATAACGEASTLDPIPTPTAARAMTATSVREARPRGDLVAIDAPTVRSASRFAGSLFPTCILSTVASPRGQASAPHRDALFTPR